MLGDLSLSSCAPFFFPSVCFSFFSSRFLTLFPMVHPSPSVSLHIPPSPFSIYFSIFLCLSFTHCFNFLSSPRSKESASWTGCSSEQEAEAFLCVLLKHRFIFLLTMLSICSSLNYFTTTSLLIIYFPA